MTASSLALVVSEQERLSAELRASLKDAADLAIHRVLHIPSGDELLGLLSETGDSLPAVLVDLQPGDEAVRLCRHLCESYPNLRLAVAAAGELPDETVVEATRAGAVSLGEAPFTADRLAKWVAPKAKPPKAKRGRLVCFVGAQDANGTSTAALHAGYALANERQQKVLLVELDFHSAVLTFRLGVEPPATLSDLGRMGPIASDDWRNVVFGWEGLDLIAAPRSSRELLSRGLPPIEAVLEAALGEYDTVIADLPAGLPSSTRPVVARADRVYLICTPELTSLHLARRRLDEVRAAGAPLSKVRLTLNRFGSRSVLDAEDVVKIVGVPLGYSLPNDYVAASEALARGGLVDDETELGQELRGLGWHILDEVRPKKRTKSLKRTKRGALEWFFQG